MLEAGWSGAAGGCSRLERCHSGPGAAAAAREARWEKKQRKFDQVRHLGLATWGIGMLTTLRHGHCERSVTGDVTAQL